MEPGMLSLTGGSDLLNLAELRFHGDLVLKDQYWRLVATKTKAYRCKGCKLVCFEYDQ